MPIVQRHAKRDGGAQVAGRIGRAVAEFSALSVAAVAAGAAYVLAAPIWVIPLAAIGTWSTLHVLLVRPMLAEKPAKSLPKADGAETEAAIADVAHASRQILALSERAIDPVVRERGAEISVALNRVVAHLRDDPDDLRVSQKFLAVYVERTKYIMARYVQYEQLATPQAEQVRHKVRDELLPLLLQLCDAQLQRITYDDLRSLETDVDVLRKSINLEGL